MPYKKELLLEISYKCNLHCMHCSSIGCTDKIRLKDIPKIVNLDEIGTVRLSGGCPLLNGDLIDYVKFFNDRNINTILQTNGTILPTVAVLERIDEVWVSLYGNEYIHDFITQVRGTYDTVNRTLNLYNDHGISIKIQSPIFNEKQLISLNCQMNTGKWNSDFNKELRLFQLLNHGRCNFALPLEKQIETYKSLTYKYHNTNLTCSLDPSECNYENKLVLKPDGSLFNCASHKHQRVLCKR